MADKATSTSTRRDASATTTRVYESRPDDEAGRSEAAERVVVQVNGEVIGSIMVGRCASKRDLELAALALPEVRWRLDEGTVKHTAFGHIRTVNLLL